MIERLPADQLALFQKPWVHVRGFTPDIGEFYQDMDLILSPVIMGTGINVKTVQAMAFGMPLLTTECGSKGIETGDLMHTHADLDALATTLITLSQQPGELSRLAALSRDRYDLFYGAAVRELSDLFEHPKLAAELGVASSGDDTHVKDLSPMGSLIAVERPYLGRLHRGGSRSANRPTSLLDDRRVEFNSFEEWLRYRNRYGIPTPGELAQALSRLQSNGFYSRFLNEHAAPSDIVFPYDVTGFRESLLYKDFNSRHRATLDELSICVGKLGTQETKIYIAEAFSQFSLFLKGRYPYCYASEYSPHPEIRKGLLPVPSEDLASLSMPEETFDVVIVNDIFEHLPDLPKALSEIGRVLKPSGALISTFAFNDDIKGATVKARLRNGQIEHLEEPEYRTDPLDPMGSLVFARPGWEILNQARAAGFCEAKMIFYGSERYGVLCGYRGGIWILVAVK
jgi:SAM-dependent methyltransferase